jgi:hypothetical protein
MDLLALLNQIDSAYAEPELQGLCAQLGVDYRVLPGYAKRDKARELIATMSRRGQLASLAAVVASERPALAPTLMPLVRTLDGDLDWLDRAGDDRPDRQQPSGRSSGASAAGAAVSVAMPVGAVTPVIHGGSSGPVPPVPPPAGNGTAGSIVGADLPATSYTPGRPLTDAAMFVGRAGELQFLREAVDAGQHIALVGPRRIGKTSLLRHFARGLAGTDGRLVALAELSEPRLQEENALVRDAWRQLWSQVKSGPVPAVEGVQVFMALVRKLNAAGFRPVLVLDDVEQLAWRPRTLGAGLVDGLRALAAEQQVTLVVAATAPLGEVFMPGHAYGPFAALFRQLDLGLLDDESARSLLMRPGVETEGIPNAGDDLIALAGPHPFYLHLAGHYLVCGPNEKPPADCFSAAAEPFFQDLWESLSPLAQSALLARSPATNPVMARQLRVLANRGVLVPKGEGYRPFGRAFEAWLNRQAAAKVAVLAPAPVPA